MHPVALQNIQEYFQQTLIRFPKLLITIFQPETEKNQKENAKLCPPDRSWLSSLINNIWIPVRNPIRLSKRETNTHTHTHTHTHMYIKYLKFVFRKQALRSLDVYQIPSSNYRLPRFHHQVVNRKSEPASRVLKVNLSRD